MLPHPTQGWHDPYYQNQKSEEIIPEKSSCCPLTTRMTRPRIGNPTKQIREKPSCCLTHHKNDKNLTTKWNRESAEIIRSKSWKNISCKCCVVNRKKWLWNPAAILKKCTLYILCTTSTALWIHIGVHLENVRFQKVGFQNVWFQNVRFQNVRFTKRQVYKTSGFEKSDFKTSSF